MYNYKEKACGKHINETGCQQVCSSWERWKVLKKNCYCWDWSPCSLECQGRELVMPLVHCIALILVISLGAPLTEKTAAWHAYTMWGGPDSLLSTSESLPAALGGVATQSLIQALSWLNASYLQCLNGNCCFQNGKVAGFKNRVKALVLMAFTRLWRLF